MFFVSSDPFLCNYCRLDKCDSALKDIGDAVVSLSSKLDEVMAALVDLYTFYKGQDFSIACVSGADTLGSVGERQLAESETNRPTGDVGGVDRPRYHSSNSNSRKFNVVVFWDSGV